MKKTIPSFFLGLGVLCLLGSCSKSGSFLSYVNPMVGTGQITDGPGNTDSQHGQTIPAVLTPNGMNFWTPQTEDTEKKGTSPYYYSRKKLQGFRNSHWITGGCTQDYGSATLMPIYGALKCQGEARASRFDRKTEQTYPDYYAVDLEDYGIRAEMTGTSRTAIFRFTYQKAGEAHLIIAPNSDESQGTVTIDPEKGIVTGINPVHRIYQGKGEHAGFNGYFRVELKGKTLTDYGVYAGDTVQSKKTTWTHHTKMGAYLSFQVKAGEEVLVKMSSSFCDLAGAEKNMQQENPGWNFDAVRKQLTQVWKKQLNTIQVTTQDSVALKKFYTAFYHASFLPHAFNDVDGRYPSFAGGKEICQTSGTYYEDYSLWDTYRAEHPLLCLLFPKMEGEMVQSFLDKYKQGGWLPIFPCWNSYTSEMIGDHCASLVVDAYQKGVRNFDVNLAYEALRKNAFETPSSFQEYKDGKGRRALDSYLKYGYIPLEDPVKEAYHKGEQVSRTLEYAYDDYVLSILAKNLGKDNDFNILRKRSLSYKNVFDPETGWVQGRHADGTFLKEKNTFQFCSFITEGYPSHYSWYVPHDVYGMMECMGGKQHYIEKLDSVFHQKYYWHGNEPCHQVAFLYNYAGQPWKTQQVVRSILNTEYRTGADGLSGNDDAGQMSAWYIFAALGFYPVCPGTPYYVMASPSFTEARIHLENGKTFRISAPNASEKNIYIQSVKLNGKPYTKNYLRHEDLVAGGTLEVEMGAEPNQSWGAALQDCPPDTMKE